MFFANRNTQKNMQFVDKIHTVFTATLNCAYQVFPATYGLSTDSFVGIQASYYAFAALRNRVEWCMMMFSSVSGMPDFSPKSVTLQGVTDLGEKFTPS